MKIIHAQNSNFDMKDIKFSGGNSGELGTRVSSARLIFVVTGECYVVLGAMQLVKVPIKFMT